MNNPADVLTFEQLLRDVSEKTETSDYAEALAILEIAHSSDPGNIYIAALKRQLESLFTLHAGNELTEEHRRELTDPMPGIVECALREFQQPHTPVTKHSHAAPPGAPAAAPPPELQPLTEEMASKELEALKLLYFQRASKFVMRGEYEQALSEVQRVFVVDPENRIAKEYASRVEHLIDHARKLASEPIDDQPGDASDPAPEVHLAAGETDDPNDHGTRATSWDDDFLSPATPAPIPVYRTASPTHRQTVAYGDSLAAVLGPIPGSPADEQAPRRSPRARVLIAAAAVLFVGGGLFAIIASINAGAGEVSDPSAIQLEQKDLNLQATAAAVSLRDQPADESASPVPGTHGGAAPQPIAKPPAVAEQKPKAEPPPPSESAKQKAPPVQDPAPVKEEKTLPMVVAEPTPAQVEPPPESPAFIAVEKEPQIVSLVKPQFPGFVWRTAGEGQVVIKVLIDIAGKPIDTQILKSSNVVFEEGVTEAVMKSQFAPAQMGQGPVSAWLTIPFRFKQPR